MSWGLIALVSACVCFRWARFDTRHCRSWESLALSLSRVMSLHHPLPPRHTHIRCMQDLEFLFASHFLVPSIMAYWTCVRNPVFVAISSETIIKTRLLFGGVFRIGHDDPIENKLFSHSITIYVSLPVLSLSLPIFLSPPPPLRSILLSPVFIVSDCFCDGVLQLFQQPPPLKSGWHGWQTWQELQDVYESMARKPPLLT